jgi:hypothetical protein
LTDISEADILYISTGDILEKRKTIGKGEKLGRTV